MHIPNLIRKNLSPIIRVVLFIIPVFFLGYNALAATITRTAPSTTRIPVNPTIPSGSCPSDINPGVIPGHISICGVVKTIDLNTVNGVQFAQEPIKGATVALYLGAKYAQGISSSADYIKRDPNGTGEVAGKIEGLYTYNITNANGHFVVAAPRATGTNGMGFLAFFCGDYLKDLYMIDLSKDIGFMPISLSCGTTVTPSNHPNTNNIPAPPSVDYANRSSNTSCEEAPNNNIVEGDPGMLVDYEQAVAVPLQASGLDDTRLGAKVTQTVSGTCRGTEITNHATGETRMVYDIINEHIAEPVFKKDTINGRTLEVPEESVITSRRDLEGFTQSSLGYSFQAISSLNCGVGGCYDVVGPARGVNEKLTINKEAVSACNTDTFPSLNCKGPGVELAEPLEWDAAYKLQRDTKIFSDGTTIGQITEPQYTRLGQLIQEILAEFEIPLEVSDSDTPDTVIPQLERMLGDANNIKAFTEAAPKIEELVQNINILTNPNSTFGDRLSSFIKITGLGLNLLFTVGGKLSSFVGNILLASLMQNDEFRFIYDNVVHDTQALIGIVEGFQNIGTDQLSFSEFLTQSFDTLITVAAHYYQNIAALIQLIFEQIMNLDELLALIERIPQAIEAISQLRMTDVDKEYFPYSTLLNYNILGNFRINFENRPKNDSYKNVDGFNLCESSEGDRQKAALAGSKSDWPFKACYAGVFLAQDTYSVQKALFTTTKNTNLATVGETSEGDKVVSPVVQKFLMPGEQVGQEASPEDDSIPSSVTNLPMIGRGYWRIGIVDTVCTHGVYDYVKDNDVDYPVKAAYGQEGNLNAAQ